MDDAVRADVFSYLGGIAREAGAVALAINGTADHVHLLVSYPPVMALAEVVRLLKTNSAPWLHRKYRRTHTGFAWQTGFGAFSVSHFGRTAVSEYIARQEEHHRRSGFAEEFIALLKKHGAGCDERFVLG